MCTENINIFVKKDTTSKEAIKLVHGFLPSK